MSHTEYRNRHVRGTHWHFGDLPSTLVELSSAIGVDMPAGTSLEETLRLIDLRLQRLENGAVSVRTLKADAYIIAYRIWLDALIAGTVGSSHSADAAILKAMSGSASADAIMLVSQAASAASDAIIKATQQASTNVDARIMPTFTTDAWLAAGSGVWSFFADAIVSKMVSESITAEAAITDVTSDSVAADAIIQAAMSATANADAIIEKAQSGSFSVDARFGGIFTADATLASGASSPSYVGKGTASAAATGSITPTLPTHESGDLLVFAMSNSINGTVNSTPSGWTFEGSTAATESYAAEMSMCYKIATGSDSNPTWGATSTNWVVGNVIAFRDVDTPTLLTTGYSNTNSSTRTLPSDATSSDDGSMILFLAAMRSSATVSTAACAALESANVLHLGKTTLGSDGTVGGLYGIKASAGAIGAASIARSSGDWFCHGCRVYELSAS